MNKRYGSFVLVILMGIVMASGAAAKILFGFYIDSDWFWFLAGVGLSVEGIISFRRQKRFDKKYKIIEKKSKT